MITGAGLSDIGCKRYANEDRIVVDPDNGFFVLADGMGGEQCGGQAAEIATATVTEYFREPAPQKPAKMTDRMDTAIRLANERVYAESIAAPECAGMGCTLSAMLMTGNIVTIGHVGDSRAYLYRNKELLQLTRDDSVVANLLATGDITPIEAHSHPMRNRLTQSVGFSQSIGPQVMDIVLYPGDRLLLTSDGMHSVIGDAGIIEVLTALDPPSETAQKLILATRKQGAPDNTSVIVIDYQESASSG
jgi:serine/threonine protein phosphatase PrpC